MVPGVQNTVTPGPVWIGPWTHPLELELDELPPLELPALELPVDELPLELELEPKSAASPAEHPTSTSTRAAPRFMRAAPSSRG